MFKLTPGNLSRKLHVVAVVETTFEEKRGAAPPAENYPDRRSRFRGLLLGQAVGDAIGLPAEGIPRPRAVKLFRGRWRHRLVWGRGMVSDDTEHAFFVGQCLLACGDSAEAFARRLGWCLRWWLLSIPAGVGFATLRSIVRLWLGFDPSTSGVFSAGNGPAMRAPVIGATFASSPELMDAFIEASTRITHTDPKASIGARAIAALAAWIVCEKLAQRPSPGDFISVLEADGRGDDEWVRIVSAVRNACEAKLGVGEFARELGLERGVSGYVYHTVPIVVYAWYRHFGDFEKTLSAVVECGGDTDTTGAIAGALAGATVGEAGVPADWLSGIIEWPRSIALLGRLADELAGGTKGQAPSAPLRYFWPGCLLRNTFFTLVVLLHGFRRALPPY